MDDDGAMWTDVVGDGDGRRGDGEGVRVEATVRVFERTRETRRRA